MAKPGSMCFEPASLRGFQSASQPQIQAITPQAQANVQGQAATPPGNTLAGPAAPATTTLAGPTLAIPFLTKTYAGNIIGILGLLFALVALGFSIFSSVVTYRDLKWSEQVNAIQACRVCRPVRCVIYALFALHYQL